MSVELVARGVLAEVEMAQVQALALTDLLEHQILVEVAAVLELP
jgi:hypothetical protein